MAKSINQTEFARLCNVSRQTIHAIEAEKYTPSVKLALKISEILKVKVEQVFILKDGHE